LLWRQIVEEYQGVMGAKMGKVIGRTLAELDGRFCSVRTGESNLGNMVCDIWQKATGAEAVLLNSGSLRSDMLHPAGEFAEIWVEVASPEGSQGSCGGAGIRA
jgi:5'-nucleotidase